MSDIFFANLRGAEEVPPVRTRASGNANLSVNKARAAIRYRLQVNNLRRFTQAHIHVGARGVNGPVVVFLFGPVSRGISVTKGVVTGTITRKDLVGPLKGQPLSTLVRLMSLGQTYVNAHTEQFPDGEVRGQIRRIR